MAAVSNPAPSRQPWSMNELSSELLALIFEHLRDVDAGSLATARLLSRRFDAIVTPIKYKFLYLSERILAPEAQAYIPDALEKIYVHTRHVQANSDLDPQNIKRLLDRIQRLSTVRWTYIGAGFCSGDFWLPADVLSPRHIQLNKTKLYIDDLPLRNFTSNQQDVYFKSIPSNVLTSLKLASPAPPLTNRLESLKQLLLRSRNLETFFYQDRGQGTHFTFSEDETLPSFKELVLRSYDWGHTETEVEDHWDFSSIRLLRLIDVPIFEFLRSVPFEDLTDLHTLQCDDFSAHLAADRRQEATRGLYCLVKKIRSLRDLEFTCHTQHFPLDALFHHGKSLHHLRIRDHVGFSDEDRRCPTIWPADLAALSQKMVKLETLELDMDTAYCDPPLFLEAICNFPRLHTLTLHVQTVLRALEVVHPDVDRDYEAAMRNFRALVRGKMGVSWRSITINVGGWKQHMVRRLSEAWRTQNAQGVYAERCFVLKRSAAGEITLREEMSFEH
ncbi:F-box domain-containing protein [Truncatella angustata]|uniref:F-box domain-containing protein n=1 Tax=Truncatella angustata TaxID=152316 RepID=A0A9P8UGF3_9PEZI|nr:F-box domain-containing protein [Truncatella angustata]KAH6651744.1 F-box domain-containing protein [Truncatella angustata]